MNVTITQRQDHDGDKVYSAVEASALLGISPFKLYRLMDTGKVPKAPQLQRHYLFRKEDIEAVRQYLATEGK